MTVECYRKRTTEELLKWKKDLEFQKSNWMRRVAEQRADYNKGLQTIGEYQGRIRECKKHLKLIDKVLKEREVKE